MSRRTTLSHLTPDQFREHNNKRARERHAQRETLPIPTPDPLAAIAKRAKSVLSSSAMTVRDYTPDELEFQAAMDVYKRAYGRPFPSWCEVFAVFESLGYRKVQNATERG